LQKWGRTLIVRFRSWPADVVTHDERPLRVEPGGSIVVTPTAAIGASIVARSGKGLQTEPTTAAERCRREPLFMPEAVGKRAIGMGDALCLAVMAVAPPVDRLARVA
jgi:hypothetical protein